MVRILCLSFLLVCETTLGQSFSTELFHEGLVVTSNKDTLYGDLKYDLVNNTVYLSTNNKVFTLSSRRVLYFEINDKFQEKYRQFYSIPSNISIEYKIPIFFELVYEGRLSLLRRESVVELLKEISLTSKGKTVYYKNANILQSGVVYEYYFLNEGGKIHSITKKKKDLYHLVDENRLKLKKFLKENKIDLQNVRDLIHLTSFYNSI